MLGLQLLSSYLAKGSTWKSLSLLSGSPVKVGTPFFVGLSPNRLTLGVGDILVINPSVTRIMSKWGETLEQVKGVSTVNDHQTIYDHHGNVIISEPQDFTRDGFRTLMTPRGYLHLIIYEHAKSIGVKVHFGTPITEVFEDDDCAGVYVDGKRIVADGVIAADGVHSKVRRQILQDEGRTQSSGFAIYRSFYDTERLLDDLKTRAFIEGPKDDIAIWIGPDAHALVLTDKKIGKIGCFLTHKVSHTMPEVSKGFPG